MEVTNRLALVLPLCVACGSRAAEHKVDPSAIPEHPATECSKPLHDGGIVPVPGWRSEVLASTLERALRDGREPLRGQDLLDINAVLSDRLVPKIRPGWRYRGGVRTVGLGACCPLWDPDYPKDFLCLHVGESNCPVSLDDIAVIVESELQARKLEDVQTGVCLFHGIGRTTAL